MYASPSDEEPTMSVASTVALAETIERYAVQSDGMSEEEESQLSRRTSEICHHFNFCHCLYTDMHIGCFVPDQSDFAATLNAGLS